MTLLNTVWQFLSKWLIFQEKYFIFRSVISFLDMWPSFSKSDRFFELRPIFQSATQFSKFESGSFLVKLLYFFKCNCFLNMIQFSKRDIFPRYENHFSKSDTFFKVWQLFQLWAIFWSVTKCFVYDPFFQMYPLFQVWPLFLKCDPFCQLRAISESVIQFFKV